MAEWASETVENCLARLSLGALKKLQTAAYKTSGRYPIVDQGQSFVAGWTDDASGLVSDDLPVIVFGDHTRALKFVDFPFVRGADGTQILKPREGIDPLYFYFACRALDVQGRGYNRHFSVLKEKLISLPPQAEQSGIGIAIRHVENSLTYQADVLSNLLLLRRASTRELFTRGLHAETQKETEIGPVPTSWEIVPFAEAFAISQGQVDPKIEPYASMLHVGPENVEQDTGRLLTCLPAKDSGLISGKYLFHQGDIVYSKIRPYLRKVVLVDFEGVCSADMYPLKPLASFNRYFLFSYLLSDSFTAQATPHQGRTGIPKINRDQLASTKIPRPPLSEQLEIAEVVHLIDQKIELNKQKHSALQDLFKALLHKLTTGEIRVADLDLSVLGKAPLEGVAA